MPKADLNGINLYFEDTGTGIPILFVHEFAGDYRSWEPQLRSLEVPTLVITGDEDEPCLEPGLLMKRAIPSAALVVMPRCGHTIDLEDPVAFNRHLEDFFAQVDAGRWSLRNPASLSRSALLPPGEDRA
jgi:pimeloyl-ACP methyl ester carboxylesterase